MAQEGVRLSPRGSLGGGERLWDRSCVGPLASQSLAELQVEGLCWFPTALYWVQRCAQCDWPVPSRLEGTVVSSPHLSGCHPLRGLAGEPVLWVNTTPRVLGLHCCFLAGCEPGPPSALALPGPATWPLHLWSHSRATPLCGILLHFGSVFRKSAGYFVGL